MSVFVPDVGEVRDSLVYLNKHYAKQYGDVDLLVVGSETAAQFDRMIAEVERKSAEKALTDAADKWQWGGWASAPRRASRAEQRIDNGQYVTDWLRARAEAYRREGKE